MGNLHGSSSSAKGSPPLVCRPYEEAIKGIMETLPIYTVMSYGRIREPIPCGKVSNWITYRLPSCLGETSKYSLFALASGRNINNSSSNELDVAHRDASQHMKEYNNSAMTILNEGDRARMARCCFSSASDFMIINDGKSVNIAQLESNLLSNCVPNDNILGHISLLSKTTTHDKRSSPPSSTQGFIEEYGDLHSALATQDCQPTITTNVTAPTIMSAPVVTTTTSSSSVPTASPVASARNTNNNTTTTQLNLDETFHHDTLSHPPGPRTPNQKSSDLYPLPKKKPVGAVTIPVYGHIGNHKPFLEPEILDYFLPFLLDTSLSSCLSVCPHWFVSIYTYLQQRVTPIVEAFKATYSGKQLEFETSTFSVQPLFTAVNAVVRIDLLIYCKVLSSCANHCTQFGYSFSYQPPVVNRCSQPSLGGERGKHSSQQFPLGEVSEQRGGSTSNDPLQSSRISPESHTSSPFLEASELGPPPGGGILRPKSSSDTDGVQRQYQSQFRFETLKKNSRRTVWIHRDMCRFHGDELMVASLANVPTINVDNRLEIPVNISNAFGLVDLNSITWFPGTTVTSPYREFGQMCEIERPQQQWVGLDAFQPTTNERLQVNDHFGPQWRHLKTEFTGIDITCSRSLYKASEPGEVPQSRRWLGIESIVKPAGTPIVCPLTRLGLQHDRFSRQQIRQGDNIVLYVSQGGGILQ